MDIRAALAHGVERLAAYSDSPREDAKWLLANVLRCETTRFITHPDQALSEAQARRFQAHVQRRRRGEPVAYLTGRRGFWNLDLAVGPGVLIPRPETELLVETALEILPESGARVLDLGTGSGAIALALAKERPAWEIVATDRSRDALKIARANRDTLGLGRVKLLQGNWYEPLAGEARFDLIVSNPPYVAEGDPHLKTGDLRFEPIQALVSGADGLDDIRRIVGKAGRWLLPDGWLLVEHGHDQSDAVLRLFEQAGMKRRRVISDLAGCRRSSSHSIRAISRARRIR